MLMYFFFFNDTATTEIYTLSLHDALPICKSLFHQLFWIILVGGKKQVKGSAVLDLLGQVARGTDRKSTRLNSSHTVISYAVFCLKKKIKIRAELNEHQSVGRDTCKPHRAR